MRRHDEMLVGMRDHFLAASGVQAAIGKRYHRIVAPENESPPYVQFGVIVGGEHRNLDQLSKFASPRIVHRFYGVRTQDGVKKIIDLFNLFYDALAGPAPNNHANTYSGSWNGKTIQLASWDMGTYLEDFDQEAELPFIACELAVRYLI